MELTQQLEEVKNTLHEVNVVYNKIMEFEKNSVNALVNLSDYTDALNKKFQNIVKEQQGLENISKQSDIFLKEITEKLNKLNDIKVKTQNLDVLNEKLTSYLDKVKDIENNPLLKGLDEFSKNVVFTFEELKKATMYSMDGKEIGSVTIDSYEIKNGFQILKKNNQILASLSNTFLVVFK